jgi:hypothetical protein
MSDFGVIRQHHVRPHDVIDTERKADPALGA